MSLMRFSMRHGRTLDEARAQLEATILQVQSKFGPLVQRVEWNAARDQVRLDAVGGQLDLRVDAHELHLEADIPLVSRLLGQPLIAGLKGLLEQTFQKKLQ
ncbi:MAG TPA: polyhydroxyalkanoic acid system family protein [Pirellulales bacterium]